MYVTEKVADMKGVAFYVNIARKNAGGIEKEVRELREDVDTFKADFEKDAFANIVYVDESNKIVRLNTMPSLVSIIHNWGFVGGSTSSGEMEYTEGGATKYTDIYEYSIGQRLCALNGVQGYNFSSGGQYAKGWCNGTGVRTWENAQKSDNLKQSYVIDLGANDVGNQMSQYSGGVGNVQTDIDWNNYNNNADTFVGWYAGVIQRLISVVANPYIFIFTSRKYMYNQSSNYATIALPKIREIYAYIKSKYQRVYLIDNYEYGISNKTPYQTILMNGGHPSVIGYQLEAFVMNTLIDKAIRDNYADFKEACFAVDGKHRQ